MAHTYTVKSYETVDVEDGVYPATITRLEDVVTTFGPGIKWYFDLGDGAILTGLCNDKGLSPKSKLYKWYCGAMGLKELEEDAEVDIDDVVGKSCRVQVENREGTDRTWANVTRVLPAAAGKPAPKKLSPQPTADDDDIDNM